MRIKIIMMFLLLSTIAKIPSYAKDNIIIGMRLEPPHLDPTVSSATAIDEIVYNNIFEGLFSITKSGAVAPLLATQWALSEDRKIYTITVHKNVFFHNGEVFDADSVVFSFPRILKKNSLNPRVSLFENVKSIKSLSTDTIRFTLYKPDVDFLYKLALPDAVIVGKSSHDNNKMHPVGTGPFELEGVKKGYFVKLRRNQQYYGKMAYLKNVKFKFYPSISAATAGLLSGGIDAFPVYGDSLTVPVLKARKNLKIIIGTTEGETLLALNNAHPKLKDIRVRQALHYGIDKNKINTVVLQGRGRVIGSHFPPHSEAYVDVSNVYPYNVSHAKDLLKQAGAENLKLELTVPPSYDLLAQEIARQLRRIGVTVRLKKTDWATWLSQVFKKRKYDMTVVTHLEPRDYDIYAKPSYYFSYKNGKDIQVMLDALQGSRGEKNRKNILQKIQKKLNKDAVNVWLYQFPKVGVWNASLKGMWENSPVEGTPLRQVYWSK